MKVLFAINDNLFVNHGCIGILLQVLEKGDKNMSDYGKLAGSLEVE